MSKERKFHEWIEQQNREEKDRVWAKIQQKEEERLSAAPQQETKEEQPVIPKPTAFSWRKWAAIAATSLAVVLLGAFAVVKFLPFDDSIVNSSNDDSSGRYFDVQSYDTVETQITLKEYAQEIGENLLYFDWYAETDHLKNNAWQLKDTKEIICFQEETVDVNTGCIITIFVVDVDVQLEAFWEDENTQHTKQINDTVINWRIQDDRAIANFEYEDHRYYLRIKEPLNEAYVFALLEELLP